MELKIITGNVGCGKSFLASRLAKQFGDVVVNIDSIQQMIGGGQYELYDPKKKEIYREVEEEVIISALSRGFSVVVDRTNMDRKRRSKYILMGEEYNAKIISYNFGMGYPNFDLPRRFRNSRGIPKDTWIEVHKKMLHSYEKPSLEEGFDKIIKPPKNYVFYAIDFDGTIATNIFPGIGEPIQERIEHMHKIWENPKNVIIIWSCRGGEYENQMREFLVKNNIPFDFINENPMFNITGSKKIFAHTYIDDRNWKDKK